MNEGQGKSFYPSQTFAWGACPGTMPLTITADLITPSLAVGPFVWEKKKRKWKGRDQKQLGPIRTPASQGLHVNPRKGRGKQKATTSKGGFPRTINNPWETSHLPSFLLILWGCLILIWICESTKKMQLWCFWGKKYVFRCYSCRTIVIPHETWVVSYKYNCQSWAETVESVRISCNGDSRSEPVDESVE